MKHLICLSLLAVLVGCKDITIPGFGGAGAQIVPVPVSDTRILFEAPAFAGQPVARAKFSDDWQREEYALFRGRKAQAEVVYLAATARETSLDADVGLKTMIRRWNFNTKARIAWGEEIKSLAAFGTVFVLPYRMGNNVCFGFSSEWAPALDDPEINPTKMVFGYYCEDSPVPFNLERLDSLIDSIEVSRFASGSTSSVPVPAPIDGGSGSIGNSGFPFLLARGYDSEGKSFVDRSY